VYNIIVLDDLPVEILKLKFLSLANETLALEKLSAYFFDKNLIIKIHYHGS
jgi:hypothetical protein